MTLLTKAGKPELANDVPRLKICGRCPCIDLACASIYTAPWADDARSLWARIWTTIPLQPSRGEINVDTANGQIVAIEVLGRRDVWQAVGEPPNSPLDPRSRPSG